MTEQIQNCARCGQDAFNWDNCPRNEDGGHLTTDELRVLKQREKLAREAALKAARAANAVKRGPQPESPFDILQRRGTR